MVKAIDHIARKGLIAIMRVYQLTLGALLPASCRFYPSCSQYAIEAFQTKPLPRAISLVMWRLVRCNPLCKGGYDPVPGENDHHK